MFPIVLLVLPLKKNPLDLGPMSFVLVTATGLERCVLHSASPFAFSQFAPEPTLNGVVSATPNTSPHAPHQLHVLDLLSLTSKQLLSMTTLPFWQGFCFPGFKPPHCLPGSRTLPSTSCLSHLGAGSPSPNS